VALAQANLVGDVAAGAFAQANVAYDTAVSAGDMAFTALDTAETVGAHALGAFDQANAAYGQANTATIIAQAAFDKANTGGGSSNTANAYSEYYDFDDFTTGASASLFSSGNGKLGWFLNQSSSGNFATDVALGHPGILIATTGGAANGIAFGYTPSSASAQAFNGDENFDVSFIILFKQIDADVKYQFGITGGVATYSQGCFFQKDFSDTEFFGVCKGSGSPSRTAVAALDPNIWYHFRVKRTGSQVDFSVAGTTITISTNLPDPNTSVAIGFYAETAGGSGDKQMWIDFIDIRIPGLSRA
jgi:hypothetical protein